MGERIQGNLIMARSDMFMRFCLISLPFLMRNMWSLLNGHVVMTLASKHGNILCFSCMRLGREACSCSRACRGSAKVSRVDVIVDGN
eukprot:Gb_40063 [translate_table: standard]